MIIAGSAREWEAILTLDTNETTSPKGMIYTDASCPGTGMQACAAWLKSLVPGVPVEAIPVDDRIGARCHEPQEIVTKIQQKLSSLNIAPGAQTVDSFKPVPQTRRKIASTAWSCLFKSNERSSCAAGRNFVITHEPTFYNHTDTTTSLEGDATYQAKQKFIKDNNLVIFRFHDHAHALQPDPLVVGSARMLGLTPYGSPAQPRLFVVPETTLTAFATDIAKRLNGRAIRVVGDPAMKVSRVMLGPVTACRR